MHSWPHSRLLQSSLAPWLTMPVRAHSAPPNPPPRAPGAAVRHAVAMVHQPHVNLQPHVEPCVNTSDSVLQTRQGHCAVHTVAPRRAPRARSTRRMQRCWPLLADRSGERQASVGAAARASRRVNLLCALLAHAARRAPPAFASSRARWPPQPPCRFYYMISGEDETVQAWTAGLPYADLMVTASSGEGTRSCRRGAVQCSAVQRSSLG